MESYTVQLDAILTSILNTRIQKTSIPSTENTASIAATQPFDISPNSAFGYVSAVRLPFLRKTHPYREKGAVSRLFTHSLFNPCHQYDRLNVQRGHELNVLYVFYQILGQENKSPLYFSFCVYTEISPWSEVE